MNYSKWLNFKKKTINYSIRFFIEFRVRIQIEENTRNENNEDYHKDNIDQHQFSSFFFLHLFIWNLINKRKQQMVTISFFLTNQKFCRSSLFNLSFLFFFVLPFFQNHFISFSFRKFFSFEFLFLLIFTWNIRIFISLNKLH